MRFIFCQSHHCLPLPVPSCAQFRSFFSPLQHIRSSFPRARGMRTPASPPCVKVNGWKYRLYSTAFRAPLHRARLRNRGSVIIGRSVDDVSRRRTFFSTEDDATRPTRGIIKAWINLDERGWRGLQLDLKRRAIPANISAFKPYSARYEENGHIQ